MSDFQAPQRAHEITLDIDGDPEPEDSPRRAPVPNAALALAAALLLAAAAVVGGGKVIESRTPLAEQAVADFLEAVRDKDVETALELASRQDRDDDLIVPEALDDRWEIATVAQVEYDGDAGGREAEAVVYAEIAAYDGTRLGHRFTVHISDGEPFISGATMSAQLHFGELGRAEVNDLVLDEHEVGFDQLLPGVYEFYGQAPSTLDIGMPTILVLGNKYIELGGHYSSEWFPAPHPAPTDEGIERIGSEVAEVVDGCVADPDPEICPFALPDDDRVSAAEGARWTVVAYPELTASSWYVAGLRFELATTVPGSVEIEVLVEEDGETRTALLSCAVRVEGMVAVFDHEGDVTLEPGEVGEESCRGLVEV